MSTLPTPSPISTAPVQSSVLAALDSFRKEFKPTTEHETFLVELMAHARWKHTHFQAMEASLFDQFVQDRASGAGQDLSLIDKLMENPIAALTMIQRGAAAAERSYYRAHRELLKSRAEEARRAKQEEDVLEMVANPDLQNKPISPILVPHHPPPRLSRSATPIPPT
jgi:hypothetical protein